MEQKIEQILAVVTGTKAQVDKLEERFDALEERFSSLEAEVSDVKDVLLETREVVNIIGHWCENADDIVRIGYPAE
jgi:uncharacterized coiled-coil protein SlyX